MLLDLLYLIDEQQWAGTHVVGPKTIHLTDIRITGPRLKDASIFAPRLIDTDLTAPRLKSVEEFG